MERADDYLKLAEDAEAMAARVFDPILESSLCQLPRNAGPWPGRKAELPGVRGLT